MDTGSLINEVVVSPYSPAWVVDVVRSTVASLGLEVDVRGSALKRRPARETTRGILRRPEAYFVFLDDGATVPLRIWASARQVADTLARER